MEELKDSQDNFWISYADLMAGLLFVFILVIGAVIVKHNYMTSELMKQKKSMEKLEEKAKQKEAAAEKLKKELDKTKETIYKLTSIKTNVIEKLRLKLGDKIEVDPKSGALRISGNILFQQDQDTLIESSKKTLTNILSEYIEVLMNDKEIKDNLDKIIIEGHTNSDGDYLHNLELSQKRALSVMKFLLALQPEKENELQKYVTANGRSETDLIMTDNKENKLASRRIEIKFRLKNDEAINEISRMLGSNETTN